MARIILEDVGVDFMLRKGQLSRAGLVDSVRAMALGGTLRRAHGQVGVSALAGVDLRLEDGDRLGLIGHNGAGKTTLLKVMAGILPPTAGRVRVEGRVAALLSIQLGFNIEASGYDNIAFRARFMGISEADIAAQRDEIIAFSELGDYIDLPIRTYSSGMRLRLAFAISTAFEPDILILDEWLSAGDEAFKARAADRLNSLIDRTRIVVFASHNPGLQKRVCNTGGLIAHGRLAFVGPIDEAYERRAALNADPSKAAAE